MYNMLGLLLMLVRETCMKVRGKKGVRWTKERNTNQLLI